MVWQDSTAKIFARGKRRQNRRAWGTPAATIKMGENEEKMDYLEVDESIPGQNYVCLSFVSPEALIESKESFKVTNGLNL